MELAFAPRCTCCSKGQREVLAIHEDYVRLTSEKGRACWKRCCCMPSMKAEVEDHYVLLRDTGFLVSPFFAPHLTFHLCHSRRTDCSATVIHIGHDVIAGSCGRQPDYRSDGVSRH